jgi:hypothetical protein
MIIIGIDFPPSFSKLLCWIRTPESDRKSDWGIASRAASLNQPPKVLPTTWAGPSVRA